MKKKIIIVLSIFSLFLLFGGIYLIEAIGTNTSRFDKLILLHQVEILREHLLLNIRTVQADLYLQGTRHAQTDETIANHVLTMRRTIEMCSGCHHAESVQERIQDLDVRIDQYAGAVQRVLKSRSSSSRFRAEKDNTYGIGDELIKRVNTMIALTNRKLNERTQVVLLDASQARTLLTALIALGPLLSIGLAFTLIRGFTKPINVLLDATKRLKAGDLDHRIAGLKDEFAELAIAFDDMAGSLRGNMREIEESEKRYRLLFESAADAIFILAAEGGQAGKILKANQAAAKMHGYSTEELLTMNIKDLDTPDAALGIPIRIERLLAGERIQTVVTHRTKDGTVFPVDISAGVFEVGGHKYILAIDRDITERKQAEEALQRAQQIRTAGELATGLAHEIKNPLAGIKVTMQVLSEERYLSDEDRGVLFKVIDEIKRIEVLMQGLLNFARPPMPQFTNTDINAVLETAAQLVLKNGHAPGKPGTITLVKEFGPALPEIMGDPMQLKQVFMNLLLNAVDAMPEGGTLVLKTSFNEAARAVAVAVSDSGKGIEPSVRDKIFQPFFTTKAKGTGLGLAISKRLIEEHGGTITIESSKGAGATFRISLPSDSGKRTQPA
jgi:two-component system, NtrC family, sensor histidine kinase AtoS